MQLVVFERLDDRSLPPEALAHDTGSMGAAALGFETLEAVYHGHRRLGGLLASGASAGAP